SRRIARLSLMQKPRSSRPPLGRLIALGVALFVALAALIAQHLWFSPAAREAHLSNMTIEQMEKEAASGSRDPLLYYDLARRLSEMGDRAGAEAALETTLRLDPGFARARASLATLLVNDGRDQEAVLQLQQAIRDDPSSVDPYLALGLLLQRQESWHKQAQVAEMATGVHPENSDAWILRGPAALSLRDPSRAADYFEDALRCAPGHPVAHRLAAAACLTLGQLDRAEKHARGGIQSAPKEPSNYLALGQVLLRRDPGHLPDAIQAFEQSISLGEPTGDAHLGLGQALHRQARFAEAEQQFRLALRDNGSL